MIKIEFRERKLEEKEKWRGERGGVFLKEKCHIGA